MTPDEARNWLALHHPDGASDLEPELAIEDILFEIKQFILSKPAIQKLMASRLERLDQLHQVELLFVPGQNKEITKLYLQPQDTILAAYLNYEKVRSRLKTELLASKGAQEVAAYARQLLVIQKDFAVLWTKESLQTEGVLVSQEPDPMRLLEAIRQYQDQGGFTFAQLSAHKNNPPETLLNEQKRLSLLFQKY